MAAQDSLVSSSVDTSSPLLSMDSTCSYLTRTPQHPQTLHQHQNAATYNQTYYQHYQPQDTHASLGTSQQHFYHQHPDQQFASGSQVSGYSPDYYQPPESYIHSYQQQSVPLPQHQEQPTSTLSLESHTSISGNSVQQQQVSYISTSYSPTPTVDSYYFPNGSSTVYTAHQQQQQQQQQHPQQFNSYLTSSYLQLSEVSEKRGGNENFAVKVETCESSSLHNTSRQEQTLRVEQSERKDYRQSLLGAASSETNKSKCLAANSSQVVVSATGKLSARDSVANHQTRASSARQLSIVARRKNATRETTAILKDWLYAHTHNPYPTKGEKIMLSVMTKMNLTQVSTWFANARRRMKKENKLLAWALQRPPPNSAAIDRSQAAVRLKYFINKHAKLMSPSTMLALASRLQGSSQPFLWQLTTSAAAAAATSASASSTPTASSSPVTAQQRDTPSLALDADRRSKCEANCEGSARSLASAEQAQLYSPITTSKQAAQTASE